MEYYVLFENILLQLTQQKAITICYSDCFLLNQLEQYIFINPFLSPKSAYSKAIVLVTI